MTGFVDVGEGVLLDTAVADGATVTAAPSVAQPYGEYEQLSDVVEVTVASQPAAGARVALPTRRNYDPAVDVALMLVSDTATGPWKPLAAAPVPGRELVTATTPHFSFLTSVLVPVKGIVAELGKIFEQATSGALAEAKAPTCPKPKQALTGGWSAASTGKDTVRWCLGVADSPPRQLKVVNNRRYPLSVAHPGAQEVRRTDSAIELANYAKFASPGRTLLLPRDAVSYTLAGPAKVRTEFDGSAQSLYALQAGAELAFAFLTKFGLVGNVNKGLSMALASARCVSVLQDPSQAGRILRDCFDPAMLAKAFGPSGLFLAAVMTVAPVAEFFRSSLNALGDQLNGRDRYGITVGYLRPAQPAAPAAPALDPKCKTDRATATLCRFVVAATSGKMSGLRQIELEAAGKAADLPKRAWTITFCELEGDITVLCEIKYMGAPANSEPVSAGFYLQPYGGEYNPDSGGYDVADGADFGYEVIDYLGLGVGGTFGAY